MEMKTHSAVSDLKSDYEKGKMTRREFIRFATLLGVSAAAATQMAGLAWPGRAQAAAIKRGGKLRVAAPVQKAYPGTDETESGRQLGANGRRASSLRDGLARLLRLLRNAFGAS